MRNVTLLDLAPRGAEAVCALLAVTVMKIATGEIEESGQTDDGKSKAAVELGRKGGLARAAALSKSKRKKIAIHAAQARWQTRK